MSAAVVICTKEAGYLATDGAWTHNGKLTGIGAKVVPLPNIPAAVTVLGSPKFLPILLGQILEGRYTDFEAIATNVGARIKKVADHFNLRDEIAVVGVGWSDGKSLGFDMHSISRPSCPTPFEAKRFGVGTTYALPSDAQMNVDVASTWRGTMNDQNVGGYVSNIMAHQRNRVWDGKSRIVGGFIQLTTVRPDHIVTKVVHRWPDKAGKMIT